MAATPPDAKLPNIAPVAAMATDLANLRFARHAQLLARWPVLAEPWARRVEESRLAAVDRTPGAATFGR